MSKSTAIDAIGAITFLFLIGTLIVWAKPIDPESLTMVHWFNRLFFYPWGTVAAAVLASDLIEANTK